MGYYPVFDYIVKTGVSFDFEITFRSVFVEFLSLAFKPSNI